MFSCYKDLLKILYFKVITIFVKDFFIFNYIIIDVKYSKFQKLRTNNTIILKNISFFRKTE